jgi:hypothetical protein
MRRPGQLVIAAAIVLQSTASALFVVPDNVPVERLLRNTRAYVHEQPKDPDGYYTLARIHYMAFAHRVLEIPADDPEEGSPPKLAPDWLSGNHARRLLWEHATQLVLDEFGYAFRADVPQDEERQIENRTSQKVIELGKAKWCPPGPTHEELNRHAASASVNFKKAIQLDRKRALHHLGLASLFEQYAEFLQENCGVPTEFTAIILDRARNSYHTAYSLSVKKDLRRKHLPIEGLHSLVSHEAGQGYVRLSARRLDVPWTERLRLARIKRNLDRLQALRPNMVTPIVFSLAEHTSLADLLAPNVHVRFDLDGDGLVEEWPWVKPTTGILVWDPDRTGGITSGRQLFGSVTWWLFFPDGYRALDCLDDNRDGMLTGEELTGISVWFDANANGRSEKGEVVPIEELGVVSLAIRATGKDGNALMNPAGLAFSDGRTIPTYDWVASRAGASNASQ